MDVSGSMIGHKIEQLKSAMKSILDDLDEGDYFNILTFSYSVKVGKLYFNEPHSINYVDKYIFFYKFRFTIYKIELRTLFIIYIIMNIILLMNL